MEVLPINEIKVDLSKIKKIDNIMQSTFRLITFSRQHKADDLLNAYLSSTADLKELLSIKNAQMEAQTVKETETYLNDLNKTLKTVIKEIESQINFNSELQLFQLFRAISPESHAKHPNKYRNSLVQIGAYICPNPSEIRALVSQLFYNISQIDSPIIQAIYLHHELIRIHPFIDGNGRTTRIAKNWILMYHLYPPVFIRDEQEKKEYISTLANSFNTLEKEPKKWNDSLEQFFNQELKRIENNATLIFNSVSMAGKKRVNSK
jgi:Fic family protein